MRKGKKHFLQVNDAYIYLERKSGKFFQAEENLVLYIAQETKQQKKKKSTNQQQQHIDSDRNWNIGWFDASNNKRQECMGW